MTQRKFRAGTVLLFVIVSLIAGSAAAACITYPTPGYRLKDTYRNHLDQDFADYGLIFEDARSRSCSGGDLGTERQGAYRALLNKVRDTFKYHDEHGGKHIDSQGQSVGPVQGWLEGAHVTLIFSAALQIGGYGDLTTELDNELKKVRDSYAYIPVPGAKCGFYQPSGWLNGGDTCMEEHTGAASAYAWIAAYEAKRGRSATTYVNKARASINAAFSTYDSICIYDFRGSPIYLDAQGRGPCNVQVNPQDSTHLTMLRDLLLPGADGKTKADILAFNRNENIVYGAGLMTGVSSALVGLEEADYTTYLSAQQQVIAAAFLEEAQRKTDPSGTYFKGADGSPAYSGTCARMGFNDFGIIDRVDNSACADGNARPKIYNLNSRKAASGMSSVYERYVSHPVRAEVYDHRNYSFNFQSAYQFNQFSSSYFHKDAEIAGQHWGRLAYYRYLGWGWNTVDSGRNVNDAYYGGGDKRPRLWGYLDDNDPKGYLDSIDANGVARGWACDRDRPDASLAVDFYVDGFAQYVTRGWANQSNEAAVTAECGGGTAHRFAIQMPAWTKGRMIYAFAIDGTWRGFSNLPGWQCPNHPACTW